MNEDVLIGVVMLVIAGSLIFIALPNKAGASPRFLRFEASLVLFPPVVIVFLVGGFAELTTGLLRIGH